MKFAKRTYFLDDGYFFEEIEPEPPIYAVQSLDAPLLYINYNNPRLKPGEAYVIYGHEAKGLEWVYSDRLWEWERKTAKESNEIAQASGKRNNSAGYYQEFLRAYFDRPELELVCVMGGYNAATCFTYWVYGYRTGKGGDRQ